MNRNKTKTLYFINSWVFPKQPPTVQLPRFVQLAMLVIYEWLHIVKTLCDTTKNTSIITALSNIRTSVIPCTESSDFFKVITSLSFCTLFTVFLINNPLFYYEHN